jgi:hypothetical protein
MFALSYGLSSVILIIYSLIANITYSVFNLFISTFNSKLVPSQQFYTIFIKLIIIIVIFCCSFINGKQIILQYFITVVFKSMICFEGLQVIVSIFIFIKTFPVFLAIIISTNLKFLFFISIVELAIINFVSFVFIARVLVF